MHKQLVLSVGNLSAISSVGPKGRTLKMVTNYDEGSSSRQPTRSLQLRSLSDEWNNQFVFSDEDETIEKGECRICQEEDLVENLEVPCACNGSMKYAHRKCVQQWCNEKQDIVCEICRKLFQPNYTIPVPPISPPRARDNINIRDSTRVAGHATRDMRAPQPATVEHDVERVREDDYEEHQGFSLRGLGLCRIATLIVEVILALCNVMFLIFMVIKDAYYKPEPRHKELYAFLYVLVGLLMPCYVALWLIHLWKCCSRGNIRYVTD